MALMVEHEKLRKLILTGELAEIAESEGIPRGLVSQLKLEWARKLGKRCVVCGDPVEENQVVCGHPRCKGVVLDPRPAGVLMMQLDQKATLRKRPCKECGREFRSSVGRELRAYRRGYTPDLCDNCRRRKFIKPLQFKPFEELGDLRDQLPKGKRGRNGRRKRKRSPRGDVQRHPA